MEKRSEEDKHLASRAQDVDAPGQVGFSNRLWRVVPTNGVSSWTLMNLFLVSDEPSVNDVSLKSVLCRSALNHYKRI